ncbi:MAG: ABC transporter substrate-binding protein, partial [Alphaproteobacteria bacterium]|nr:ABC transporter substrate-binding protein [Alphaproteobacteria bacterium]
MKLPVLAAAAAILLASVEPAAANRLRWAADTDPGTMDPYTRNVTATHSFLANIYEPLVRRGRDLALEPALATSWKQTAPDVWRFELRRDVRFHDGTPFTADDVVFSYGRARGPGSLIASYLSSTKEIRKIDDYTVEFVTDGPDPILPGNFAIWHIMSKGWAEKNNA